MGTRSIGIEQIGIKRAKAKVGPLSNWSSYWTAHLFNEGDLEFRSRSRSGMAMVDDKGSNASIALPYLSIPLTTGSNKGYSGITPGANSIWVFQAKIKNSVQAATIGTPSTAPVMQLYKATNNNLYLSWGDKQSTAFANDETWHTYILYDKRIWRLSINQAVTDAAILSAIATEVPTKDLSATAVWTGVPTGDIRHFSNTTYTLPCDWKLSFIGSITGGVITWGAKFIFDRTDFVHNIINGTNYMTNSHGTLTFGSEGWDYCLTNGYTLYHKAATGILRIPLLASGLRSNYAVPEGYVAIADIAGSLTQHNAAISGIVFPTGSKWDRSNATIYADAARLGFYNAAIPTFWHVDELNQLDMHEDFFNEDQDICFSKMTNNSCDIEERFGFVELFSYNNPITGSDEEKGNFAKVVQFTGDYGFFFNYLMLSDPFNEVVKVTALEDSVFKLNVNNSIEYTKSGFLSKVDGVDNDYFGDISTDYKRFMVLNTMRGSEGDFSIYAATKAILLNYLNSYPSNICTGSATFAINFWNNIYPNAGHLMTGIVFYDGSLRAHDTAQIDGVGFVDLVTRIIIFKAKNQIASIDEIKSDEKLLTEPIRKTNPSAEDYYEVEPYRSKILAMNIVLSDMTDPTDNLKMKLPANSTMIFPIKSDVAPINRDGGAISKYAITKCTFIAGVVGDVEMPFTLVRITGEGVVRVNGVEYDLPDDNAALVAVLQTTPEPYEVYINKFAIVSNTGGLSAEFLLRRRFYLYNKNLIEKNIISGNIKVEKDTTLVPIDTNVFMVNKGDAEKWTIDFNTEWRYNKSLKVTQCVPFISDHLDSMIVNFAKAGGRPAALNIHNYVADDVYAANAGSSFIDQCWASKLMPRDDDFDTSLELSFEAIDDSTTYYTTDGSTPDATKTAYTVPFTISATITVKWINIKAGYANSHVNTRVITKN